MAKRTHTDTNESATKSAKMNQQKAAEYWMERIPGLRGTMTEDQDDHWKDVIRECFDSFSFRLDNRLQRRYYVFGLLSDIISTLFRIAKGDGKQFVDLIANLLPEYLFHGHAMQELSNAITFLFQNHTSDQLQTDWYEPLFAHKEHNEKHQAFQFYSLIECHGKSGVAAFCKTQEDGHNTNKLFDMLLAFTDIVRVSGYKIEHYRLFCFTQTFEELVFVVNHIFQQSSDYDTSVDVEKEVEKYLNDGLVNPLELIYAGRLVHDKIRKILTSGFQNLIRDERKRDHLQWTPMMHLMFKDLPAEARGHTLDLSRILQARSEENYLVNRTTLVKAAK